MEPLLNDSFLQTMNNLSKSWGDMFWNEIQELEAKENEKLPKLVHRRDIWMNFPVHVIPQGFNSNAQQIHNIVWNKNKLIESEKNTIESELIRALRLSESWTVHNTPNTIAQICMKKQGFHRRSEDVPIKYKKAELKSLNDICFHYPVVWKQISPSIYGLELHKKRVQEYVSRKGFYCIHENLSDLIDILKKNSKWSIIPGDTKYFLYLQNFQG